MLLLIGITAGLTNVLGRMVKDERQDWALFAVMSISAFHRRDDNLLVRGAWQSRLRRV